LKPYILVLLAFAFSLSSCGDKVSDPSFPFEAEVLGINMDCGIPAVKFTGNTDRVNEIAGTHSSGSIFIAKNLPAGLQTEGLSIVLKIRKIQDGELGACTAMGPGYPWIYVVEARVKE